MPIKKIMGKKILGIFLVSLLVCYLYYYLNNMNYAWYTWHTSKHPCKTEDEDMTHLVALIQSTHKVLTRENLTHFLVYGSLWGALRFNNPLPWDNDFDFGLFHRELLQINENDMFKRFKEENVKIAYKPYSGSYRVTRDGARGDLMIFKHTNDNTIMNRVGFESYLFFINYRNFHSFPARLVKLPLSNITFAGMQVPVPHFGVELQKYHYPNDWWKESKPFGC